MHACGMTEHMSEEALPEINLRKISALDAFQVPKLCACDLQSRWIARALEGNPLQNCRGPLISHQGPVMALQSTTHVQCAGREEISLRDTSNQPCTNSTGRKRRNAVCAWEQVSTVWQHCKRWAVQPHLCTRQLRAGEIRAIEIHALKICVRQIRIGEVGVLAEAPK